MDAPCLPLRNTNFEKNYLCTVILFYRYRVATILPFFSAARILIIILVPDQALQHPTHSASSSVYLLRIPLQPEVVSAACTQGTLTNTCQMTLINNDTH